METITRATLSALTEYHWPGNVRELENVIERAVILTRGSTLELGEWPPTRAALAPAGPSRRLADVERQHILEVLDATHWRVSGANGAAALLGLKPTTLESRMKRLGIARSRQS
jgi:transcriptional regulator with GAF, ATPase, and Fis domain